MLWTWRMAPGGKRIGDLPRASAICRSVDVNFGAFAIVEIFAPINISSGDGGDVQWSGATAHLMSHVKLVIAQSARYQRAGNCTYDCLPVCLAADDRQGMKAIAHESITQRAACSEVSPPGGTKGRDVFPLRPICQLAGGVSGSRGSRRGRRRPTRALEYRARLRLCAG